MTAGPPLDNQLPLSKDTVMVSLGFACNRAVLNDDGLCEPALPVGVVDFHSVSLVEEVTYEVLE